MHPSQEARLLASLDHERTWREMLQAELATVEAAHRQAHEQLVQARLESQRQHQASARTTKICTALQERLLELEATVRQTEQQRAADADAAFDRLTQRHAEFTASLAAAARSRDALTQQLNVARAALEEARQAREAIEIAAADHRRQGQREFEIALAAAAASRADAEQQVESLRAALQQAETRHASERSADAERRAARDTEVAASLAQIAGERDALRLQLNAASAALEESQGRRAREEADARATLEQTIERAERAQREAEERYALELAAAASQRGDLQRQFEEALAQAAATRQAFEWQLSAASVAVEQTVETAARAKRETEERHALELAAAAAQQEDLQRQFDEALAQAAATREAFEHQLSDAAAALERAKEERAADAVAAAQQVESVRAALQQAETRHASERSADAERRAAHDADVAASLAQIAGERDALARQLSAVSAALEESKEQREREQGDARATLEQTVERAERAARETEERHALERAAAAAQREDLQRQFDEALAQAAATREAVEHQLSDAAAALERAKEERAADAVAAAQWLAEREAELGSMLAEGVTIRGVLEARLDEVQLALRRAEQDAETERASAGAREQSMLDDLAREAEARRAVERELSDARAESARMRRRLLMAASALRRRTIEHKARLEAQFAAERADHERRVDAQLLEIRQVEGERDALQESLGAVRGELQELHDIYDEARRDYGRAHARSEADLERLSAEYDQTRHSLEHLRDAFNTLERVSSEHALERARLESVVADRDAQMRAQESTHLATEQAAKEALRHVEETLRQTVDVKDRNIVSLEHERDTLRQELERASMDREAFRREADRLPLLQRQLDASQQENRRQFERAPYAIWRVTSDGALVATNQALARVLGYRSIDDLAKLDFAAAVFEAPADLRWLIDRTVAGGSLEPVETVWKKKDRSRLTVRLHVVRTTENWIEMAAEDVTQLRATEEDLRHARRMEAVGRLASEVAVTCDTLLRGVSQSGQHWLAAIGTNLGLRHQGERLLGDVAHATSLLQRLAAYGNEQIDALEPVNLQRVLRNLEPVLKRVAGDDIEVVLPKSIPPFSVDVERSRVERVLVNVSSYARERMPYGGRLKIDLDSAVVDRTFLDKYPNVRPGPHVIVTITEERGTTAANAPLLGPTAAGDDSQKSAGDKPGVDLSALLRLLADCGGHLWVSAEPPGNMTLKIHLPLHVSDGGTSPAPSLTTSTGGRSLGRWFRH